MEALHIFRKIKRSGIEIKIKNKRYPISYWSHIWKKFPNSLHRSFADSLTYISTWHLPMLNGHDLVYHFSHPLVEPVFFKMITYSIPMTIYEFENASTQEILKKFYNANFQTQFKSLTQSYSGKKVKKLLKEKAILLFSFGKDSLTTYCILQELAIPRVLVFMKEPQSTFENAHKRKLAERFYNQMNDEVEFFPLSIGKLRSEKDYAWGWDVALSQYAFVLIPYFFYYQAKYLFFGNEQSCNFYTKDDEGYLINPVYEQSVPAMQLLQDIPRLFSIQTHIGSLVEPIHEIFITYILHHRYPKIGRFQMSCFSETKESKKRRWCGVCEKCAWMYLAFKALDIDPARVGFYTNNMLSSKKENLYPVFNTGIGGSAYGGSGLAQDEQLLAFYLAYKRGVKGELINKFKKMYLKDVEKRKHKLIKEYFGIHSSYSLPSNLRKKVMHIYEKEQASALEYIRRIIT